MLLFLRTIAAILSYITIVIAEDDCSGTYTLNNEQKVIYNPGYPEAYSGKHMCSSTLEVPKQNYLSVFCDYELPGDSDYCPGDSLYFTDKTKTGTELCGKGNYSAVTFNTPGYFGFFSKKDTSGGKFKCTFDTAEADDPDKCICGWKPLNNGDGIYPFLGAILRKKTVKGSAAIISQWFAITTASLMQDVGKLDNIELAVGGQDQNNVVYHKLAKSISHPDYDDYTVKNNIAIIKTEQPIQFSDYVGSICLPYKYKGYQDYLPDTTTIVMWADINMKGNRVVATNVSLMDDGACEKILGEPLQKGDQCTNKKDGNEDCKLSDGAPLIWKWNEGLQSYYLLYLFSFGDACNGETMTTEVIEYLDWIDELLEGIPLCKMEN